MKREGKRAVHNDYMTAGEDISLADTSSSTYGYLKGSCDKGGKYNK